MLDPVERHHYLIVRSSDRESIQILCRVIAHVGAVGRVLGVVFRAPEADDLHLAWGTFQCLCFVTSANVMDDNRATMIHGPAAAQTLRTMRRLLMSLLLAALVGTFVELLLLGHDEGPLQLIPLILVPSAAVTLIWTAIRPGAAVVALFRVLMALMILGGAHGLVLHYQANLEFQRDLTPDASTMELFSKVMAAKAPPALAPAVLAQLGCLGLIYAYQFPVHRGAGKGEDHVANF